jgi:hypothetical protein
MDLFHLTNLEVFKNLRQGLFSESLPAQLTDLIISIHGVTSTDSPMRHHALELLTIADIQFAEIKSRMMLNQVNEALASAFNTAHNYVVRKLQTISSVTGFTTNTDASEIKSNLRWRKPKSHFAHLCHAIKVGGCIMDDDSFSELVRNMAAALNIDVSVHYVNNIISSLKFKQSNKSVTEFLDGLRKGVEEDIQRRLDNDDNRA